MVTTYPELKTLEWDILNPDRLINLDIKMDIKNKRRTSLFNLEIKKKSGSSINPDIHHSKVPSSEQLLKGKESSKPWFGSDQI